MINKKFIITTAVIVALNGIAIFGWTYVLGVLFEHGRGISKLRTDIAVSEEKIKNYKTLGRTIENLSEEKATVDALFLTRKNFFMLIDDVDALSELIGTSLTPGIPVTDLEKNKEITFPFSIEGSFKQIFNFLSLLENVPYMIENNKLSIVKNRDNDKWRASFEIKAKLFD